MTQTYHKKLNEILNTIYEQAEGITTLLDEKFDLSDSDLREIEKRADRLKVLVANYANLNNR